MIRSQRSLAKALGVGEPTVRRYLEDPRWPFSRRPPWREADLPNMKAWASSELQRPSGDGRAEALTAIQQSPERTLRLKHLLAKTNKLELEHGILARNFLKRSDVEQAFLRRIYAVKTALLSLPEELAPLLVGKFEDEIREILRTRITQALNEFATGGRLDEVEPADLDEAS